jgi:hypothetical protein
VLGNDHRVITVVEPGALIAKSDGIVVPVLHEHADHFVSLLLQKIRCDAGINTAGKADNYTGVHLVIWSLGYWDI